MSVEMMKSAIDEIKDLRDTQHSLLLEAAMAMAISNGNLVGAAYRPTGNVTNANPDPYRPRPLKNYTQLQREIAAHNAAVEARKAAKKARKAKKGDV